MAEVLDYRRPEAKPWHGGGTPSRGVMAGAYVVFGALLPAVCFLLAGGRNPAAPEFQSGKWFATLAMVPSGRCSQAFFPLLVWSMAAIVAVAAKREAARRVWVRVGLYTGVVLALQYVVIQSWALMKPGDGWAGALDVGLWVGAAGAFGGGVYLWSRWPMAVLVVAGPLGLLALVAFGRMAVGAVLIGPLALTLGVFGLAVVESWEAGRGKWGWVLGMSVLWGGAWGAAWRVAFQAAVEEYAALPKTPPNCYVATAAARGHGWAVGGEWVEIGGRRVRVNEQLRRLKCAEIALRAGWPGGHRVLRRVYDGVGRRVARGIRWAWAADVAYWGLKPAEWGAVWVLRGLAGDVGRVTGKVYRSAAGRAEAP